MSATTGDQWATSSFGNARHKGQYIDSAISGYTMPFEKRPAGQALLSVLKDGDTLIVHRVCRLCRSSKDYYRIVSMLGELGVRLIIISPKVDLGTAIGRAMIGICAVMAEFESARKGERIRAALWAKKRNRIRMLSSVSARLEQLPSDYRPRVRQDISSEVTAPGRIHLYIRVSHRSSAASGLGLLSQMTAEQAYAAEMIATCPALTHGEAFCDTAVSAYEIPLSHRTDGKRLVEALRPGDHVLFYSLDRAFRTAKDMVVTTDGWQKQGITAHFISEGFDMASPEGRVFAAVAACLGEMEASLCSARAKESRAVLTHHGKFTGGTNAPPFWRLHKFNRKQLLVMDRYQIVTFRCIKMLIESYGFTLQSACQRVESLLSQREGRVAVPLSGVMRRTPRFRSLPPRFRPYRNGMVYPTWTPRRYTAAAGTWDATIAAWRNQKQKQRDALAVIATRQIPTRFAVRRRPKLRLASHPSRDITEFTSQ